MTGTSAEPWVGEHLAAWSTAHDGESVPKRWYPDEPALTADPGRSILAPCPVNPQRRELINPAQVAAPRDLSRFMPPDPVNGSCVECGAEAHLSPPVATSCSDGL